MGPAGVAVAVAAALAAHPPAPGGSNFDWFQVDRPQPGVCDREPYGVIPNFDVPGAHAQIESELAAMYAAGQRRLRIGIFHGRGLDTGTVMDSAGGNLSARNRRNLAGLLGAVRAAGFAQVEVAFHPQAPAIADWTTWDESRFQENWQLIRHLRPIIRAAGIPYRIDLSNETIPSSLQPLMLRYSRRLWASYVHAFGRQDTVGFSLIPDLARVAQLRAVYGHTPPYTFDLHFYPGTGGLSEREQFEALDGAMQGLGFTQPWIIGEAFYDDPATAAQLASARAASQRTVYYLTQWPLTRGSACSDVDVGAPLAFGAYAAAGFDQLPETLHPPRPVIARRTLRVDRRGRVAVPIRCVDTTTRCFGTIALRARGRTSPARSFSVYGAGVVTRRVTLAGGRLAPRAAVAVTAHSEDSVDVVRRTIAIRLTR